MTTDSTPRNVLGTISLILWLFFMWMLTRQYRLWKITGDEYYPGSIGIYLVISTVIMIGVAWGFWETKRAEKVFTGYSGGLALILGLLTMYYWVTGFILDRVQIKIFFALIGFFTIICIFVVLGVVQGVLGTGGEGEDSEPTEMF